MTQHAAFYRGYRIEGEKERHGWLLRIRPVKPELPILPRSEFPTNQKTWPEAVGEATAHINALLPAPVAMAVDHHR